MIKTKISRLFRVRNPGDLIHMPVVVTVNKFDEQAAREFKDAMQKAYDSRQPIIPVLIDSYGGQVYSLLSMIDTIKSSDVPVATIISGKAMSCGAVLFTCGAEGHRYMGANATLMIHDVSSGTHGKVKEMKVDVNEAERLNKAIYKIMANNVGKGDSYFDEIVASKMRADWYLTPTEALTHNLANHIKVPSFNVSCTVKMTLE